MSLATPLLPDTADPLLAAHWKAAAQHRLEIPYCASCGAAQWPPRVNCLACHSFEFEWREIEARGELFSYFVAHKALHPSLADEVPYASGVVALPAGVKMLGRLVEVDPAAVKIGIAVSARYVDRVPGVTLVHWAPDARVWRDRASTGEREALSNGIGV
jgi:uncharacterized OB-fold protein